MKMLPRFSPEIEAMHSKCLHDKIVKRMKEITAATYATNEGELTQFEEYLDRISDFLGSRDCLSADAKALGGLVDEVERDFFNWQPFPDGSPWLKLNDAVGDAFGYENFRDKKGCPGDQWGGEILMRELMKNVRYCPYCNAETVYAIEMDSKGKGKPPLIKSAFDHFYPKGRYPFLSVSLYNLIPSCHRCNSQFKIDNYEKLRKTWHPYQNDVDEQMSFIPSNIPAEVWEGKEDDAAFSLLFVSNSVAGVNKEFGKNYNELFQLSRVYSQLYRREAIKALHSAQAYSSSYLQSRKSWFAEVGLRLADPETFLFGTPLKRQEIDKHRCSKLIQDMRDFWL